MRHARPEPASITADRRGFYALVKTKPCIVTARVGVDCAHLRLLPIRRLPWRRELGARSHRGPAGYVVVPIVPELHRPGYRDSLHELGERAWMRHHDLDPTWVAGVALRLVIEWHMMTVAHEENPGADRA